MPGKDPPAASGQQPHQPGLWHPWLNCCPRGHWGLGPPGAAGAGLQCLHGPWNQRALPAILHAATPFSQLRRCPKTRPRGKIWEGAKSPSVEQLFLSHLKYVEGKGKGERDI